MNTSIRREDTEMENNEVRAIIKYLRLRKMCSKGIFADLMETLGESAPRYLTVTRGWSLTCVERLRKIKIALAV